ncbi:glycoside hydrolase family 47 protein [Hebeloma cylindrosporum]|uniref:alpha-1,2-Mannosidase n=1 Tax=Hebeloma cylindrosporum TaxID=76867 RepID=A0A0C2XII4_HEBCY|nr:glycoside hydrolase family 47 protein [Hebeloma cylindrosporum h7]
MIGAPRPEFDYYGGSPRPINNGPPPPSLEDQELWNTRKLEVREAFKHAWTGYNTKAFPSDELLAVSGGKSDKYNGWSVTLFDSLDTMWIMGLRDEFHDAAQPNHHAPFFETTIRYLGGCLSAYALSGEQTLLDLADELGQLLIPAFTGTESGLPAYSVNVETYDLRTLILIPTVLFAEATTCQLEFKYLAKLTGKKEYYERVQTAMNVFYKANVKDGLFHDNWLMKDGKPTGAHFTIGATADSGYEYLLKQWLLSGDVQAREQYRKSAAGIINNLIYVTNKRGIMYVGDLQNNVMVHRLEHLSCYLPGVLALGAFTLDLTPEEKELHQWAAHGLASTCAITYADQASGLGPDQVHMPVGKKWKEPQNRDYVNGWPDGYLLRPETVESIFIMWRTTGDVKWREKGYAIFQAINNVTRTEYGFGSVHGVDGNVRHLDDMPSWFLAETLKYLYLLFDDVNSITFNHWVFNTEAHPLPVFSWTDAEKKAFGIP